jgi:hypothetical protein
VRTGIIRGSPGSRRGAGLGLVLVLLALRAGPAGAAAPAGAEPGPCEVSYPSDARIGWVCGRIPRGATLEKMFGPHWRDVARFNRMDRRHARPGAWIRIPDRLEDVREFTPMPERYAPADTESRFVLIDLAEQFLGAYEFGRLVFSAPVTSGMAADPTPDGGFRIDAADPRHRSTMYTIEETDTPYPMHYALRFFRTKAGLTYWIHGRDMPGTPASHGCVGLSDEEMLKRYYGEPKNVLLEDARRLFEWCVGPWQEGEGVKPRPEGPRVVIVGQAPVPGERQQRQPAVEQADPGR